MERALEEVLRTLRELRHDASNPLTAAHGNVQILLSEPDMQPEEAAAMLRIADRELRRLGQILRRIDDLTESLDSSLEEVGRRR